MLTMIAFNSVVVLLMTTSTCSYHLKCPVKSQRPLRASTYCTRSLRSEYMCLYDTNKLLFSEQCNKNQDYATRGEKYVLSGSLRNVDCSSDRYQPFTLWSNVSGECLYEKTLCEGEGQIIFSNGSLISDRTCRCDYTKGYTFIQQPKQTCFCIPYVEDCSCYIRTCDVGFTLSSDYECVGENDYYNSECPALDKKRGSWRSQIITRNNDGDVQMSFNKSDFYKVVVPGFVVCPFMLLVIVIRGKLWHPRPHTMLLVLLLFAALFYSFVFVIKHVEQDLNTVAVGVSVLVITTVLSIVFMLFLIYTHYLTQVYDEHYELQIYKLLKAASEGDTIKLKRIIHQNYIDINDTNYDTRSALHLAACCGHIGAVKYLLKKKAGYLDRKDRCLGHTPAEDAAWHERRNDNNASKCCLQRIIDLLNNQKGLQKYKCSFKDSVVLKIIKAAEYGEISVLQSLHDKGTDMNLSDNDGRTALHAAVERNHEKVIEFLIDKCKVSPFQRWRGQRPGDLIKPQFCNPKISEKLRKYTTTVKLELVQKKEKDKKEEPDLQIVRILNSALRGDIRLLKSYKAAGYDMTVSDYDNRTALHIAVKNNQEHVVEYLLKECGLTEEDKIAKDRWKTTPLEAAKKGGNEIILKLFDCPSLPITGTDDKKELRLLIAGVDNDVETLKRLHEQGWSMIFQNSIGTTVWNVDAYEWNNDAIQYLTNKSKDNNNKHKCAIVTCKKENILRQTK